MQDRADYMGFPDQIGTDESNINSHGEKKDSPKKYKNSLNPSDSLTITKGFIHGINKHEDLLSGRVLYYVRAGTLCGVKRSGDSFVDVFEDIDLLVGGGCKKFFEVAEAAGLSLSKVAVVMKIRNIRTEIDSYNDETFIKRTGVLEVVTFGSLEM